MPTAEHWRKLERMYLGAPINVYYAPALDNGDGVRQISLEARTDFHHSAGAVHGSVYFKLLDDAGFFAASSLVSELFVLTSDFTTHLLRPVSTGRLTARGEVIHRGRRQLLARAELRDADGKLVAHGVGTYVVSKTPL